MNSKFPCLVESKVFRSSLEGTDTVQLGVISNCPTSLPAANHTHPGFTYLEREISSLNCKAGKTLDIYNDIS